MHSSKTSDEKGKQQQSYIVQSLLSDSRSYWVPTKVDELTRAPTALEFLRTYVTESVPFVVRGVASEWACVQRWTSEYLEQRHGEMALTVSLTPDGYADAVTKGRFAQPTTEKWTMSQLLDNINRRDEHCFAYYSAQNSCFTEECGALAADVDETSVQFVRDAFDARETAANLWIGDERSVTTRHADPFHNMYVVVRGLKKFELRPPSDAAVLNRPEWPNARWHRNDDGCWNLVDDVNGGSTKWIPHDVKYPGDPLFVNVEPGDMLYIPPLWFHTVKQHDLTIALNWWFDMTYARDWVMKQLFDNIGDKLNHGGLLESGGTAV